MQSDQLTTDIPDHLSSLKIGQQDDSDYQDDKEEELFQAGGTMDLQMPTDNSDNNEDNEPDNKAYKRPRKIYAPANTAQKDMTKQREAKVLLKKQDKQTENAQAEINKDKNDNLNLNRPYKSKGKASTQVKLKALQKVRDQSRHLKTRYQMILNLTRIYKMKTFSLKMKI